MKTLLSRPAPSPVKPRPQPRPERVVAERLPAELERKLRTLARRHLCARMGEGVARWLMVFLGLIFAQCLTDWLLDLPVAVRAIFLFADVILLSRIAWKGIVLPWRNRMHLPEAALLVQRHFPGIRGALIASVQLADPKTDSTEGSSLMVKNLIRQTSENMRSLDFNLAVPLSPLRWQAARVLLLLVLAVVVLASCWPASGMLVARIFLLPVALPTRTTVEAVTGNLSVGSGANVELAAMAHGVTPSNGRLMVTHADGRVQEMGAAPGVEQERRFSVLLKNVRTPFQYQFILNDGRGEKYQVRVLPAPMPDSVTCEQVWPAYTGKGVEKRDPGALSLLAGSVLRLKVHSTLPLKGAEVLFDDQGKSRLAMNIAADQQTVTVEFSIAPQGLTAFSISVLGTNDVRSVEDQRYAIDVIPDEVPRITILKPTEESQTITPQSKPEMEFEVTEDFGLKSLTLCYEIDPLLVQQSEGPKPPVGVQRREFDVKAIGFKPGSPVVVRKILDIAKEQPAWREGWSVRYWIEAVDINDVTGPGVSRSYEQKWVVVSPEVKRTELLSQFRENAEAIKDFNQRQQKTSEGIRGLFDLIDSKP